MGRKIKHRKVNEGESLLYGIMLLTKDDPTPDDPRVLKPLVLALLSRIGKRNRGEARGLQYWVRILAGLSESR